MRRKFTVLRLDTVPSGSFKSTKSAKNFDTGSELEGLKKERVSTVNQIEEVKGDQSPLLGNVYIPTFGGEEPLLHRSGSSIYKISP